MNGTNLTIKQLLERYDLKQRQSIYDWCKKGAKIELQKDESGRSCATSEQVALLDQLAEHLKKPSGTLSNFVPLSSVKIDNSIDSLIDTKIDSKKSEIKTQTIDSQLLVEITSRIGIVIADQLGKQLAQIDPLSHHVALEKARALGWLLTTLEVKELIGVKPRTKKGNDIFKRGNWIFIKSGKIGNQIAWTVNKVSLDELL